MKEMRLDSHQTEAGIRLMQLKMKSGRGVKIAGGNQVGNSERRPIEAVSSLD
jgi:hypothetical protein